ncbi:hypothetical protein IV203_003339 [Nitzschia inconspicua]|uniref:Uncharacterized protein n=1 Tax=Nitzschia inconspicua TaxID=303405 RepID=A0A9K3PNM0_9STRA|nr:hypothetical protein IV203_003339 [Nitzschia inconspicua]
MVVKKENSALAGNSLLQTASNKRLGAGRFALLALKGSQKPPVQKVKIPVLRSSSSNNKRNITTNVDATDDRSKISDMTISVGELSLLSRPALIKEVHVPEDIDVESSVMDMSANSGIDTSDFSLTRAFGPGATFSLPPPKNPSTRNPFANIGTSVKTPVQPFANVTAAYQNHPSNKTVSQSLSHPMGAVTKRSMTLNKGIVFTAPSPMTLNRFEVQLGREHVAPESKEYLKQQERKKKEEQIMLEKEQRRQAKKAVKEELKREFQREQGEGFEAQLEDNFETRERLKKKSLVKQILGKIRPQSPKKNQQKKNQIKSQHLKQRDSASLDKESATAMARRALLASKQKTGLGAGTADYPIEVASPRNAPDAAPIGFGAGNGGVAVATAGKEMSASSVPFPVNEVLMQPKEDSISDLDASFRKAPVTEILMGSRDPQSRDDESVSTLGTIGVYQKHGTVLRDPNPDPPEVAPAESMPPPPMVLSQDANPLIDNLESGEKSEGTSAVEKTAALCGACFMDPQQKSSGPRRITLPSVAIGSQHLQVEREESAQVQGSNSNIVAKVEEIGEDGVEARLEVDVSQSNKDFLHGEKPMFDEVQVSSPQTDASHAGETQKSAFSLALDQAIREANSQPNIKSNAVFPDVHPKGALSPIEEEQEMGSPKSFLSCSEKMSNAEDKTTIINDGSDPVVIDLTDRAAEPSVVMAEPVNFELLMDVAASKLQGVDDRYAVKNEENRCTSTNPFEDDFSNEKMTYLESPRRVILGRLVDASINDGAPVVQGIEVSSGGKNPALDLATPRTRGGKNTPLFDLSGTTSSVSTGKIEIYEDDGGEMVMCSDDPAKLPSGPRREYGVQAGPRSVEEFSDGLFDLLPADECSEKKKQLLSQPSGEGSLPMKAGEKGNLTGADDEEKSQGKYDETCPQKTKTTEATHAEEEPNQDVFDQVFEYSGIMFCGKSRQTTSQALKSFAPTSGEQYSNSIPMQQENRKAGALFGAPFFFLNNVASQERKNLKDLPRVETVISKELTDAKSPTCRKTDSKQSKEIINVAPDDTDNVRVVEQDAAEGKFLLDHDDAYWDTLSTIASTTKDKSSSDSEKYMYEAVIPGPIPVEITMASKDIEIKTNFGSDTRPSSREGNNINKLVTEDTLPTALRSPSSGHCINQAESRAKDVKRTDVPKMLRTGSTVSGDGQIRVPPSQASKLDEETKSQSSRVADLIAVFESSNSLGSGTISSKETPGENTSNEGSGLLQAVTRSESGGSDTPMNTKAGPNREHRTSQESQKPKGAEKPCPEMLLDSSKKSKQNLKSNRSVSWGFEEIYEARDHVRQLFQSSLAKVDENISSNEGSRNIQHPTDRSVLSGISVAAAGSAVSRGLDRNKESPSNQSKSLSIDDQQNLFARTLELSRGLFGSLNPQDLEGNDEEVVRSIFSFGLPLSSPPDNSQDRELEVSAARSPTSIKSGNGTSEHSPINIECLQYNSKNKEDVLAKTSPDLASRTAVTVNQENLGLLGNKSYNLGSNRPPSVKSKLDILREQRTRALERFQLAKPIGRHNDIAVGRSPRDRDHLKFYSPTKEHLRATMASQDASNRHPSFQSQRPHSTGRLFMNRSSAEHRDSDVLSTASSSSSAPSHKARELRRQLDEALKASKEIRVSQEQLGSELRSFKSRYYRKNDEIEDHALRAITGP